MMQTFKKAISGNSKKTAGLKVNLHIVEACNMHCEFCFAKFHCMKSLALEDWKHIVDNITDECSKGDMPR